MKHLKTFESFQINEGLLDSPVYKYLQDEDNRKKMMADKVGVIPDSLDPLPKKYTDLEARNPDKKIDGIVDLSDLTMDDYKKAIEMGESNRWANPSGPMLGGPPKFFKEADEKIKKAYRYIYQIIDSFVKGKQPHGFGSGT